MLKALIVSAVFFSLSGLAVQAGPTIAAPEPSDQSVFVPL